MHRSSSFAPLVLIGLSAMLAACAGSRPPELAHQVDRELDRQLARRRADSAEIHDAIVRGAAAFERGDPAAILDRYAPDIVLAYPGEPDMDYATLAKGYAELRGRPAGVRATTAPTFDEFLISGDLALVRLRWTTTIASAERTATRRMKDFQLWRRDPGGRWMFVRGMHYREPEPAPPK